MTVKQVADRLRAIEQEKDDFEVAHAAEKRLYMDVLQSIAEGAKNPGALAREALKACDIEFIRVYA